MKKLLLTIVFLVIISSLLSAQNIQQLQSKVDSLRQIEQEYQLKLEGIKNQILTLNKIIKSKKPITKNSTLDNIDGVATKTKRSIPFYKNPPNQDQSKYCTIPSNTEIIVIDYEGKA